MVIAPVPVDNTITINLILNNIVAESAKVSTPEELMQFLMKMDGSNAVISRICSNKPGIWLVKTRK